MENILKEQFSCLTTKKVLIACSTGIDSMALLEISLTLLDKENIAVVHVHHNKRAQSDRELEYIKTYCKQKNLKLYVKKLPEYHGKCFQAWAREQRYEFFLEISKEYNYNYLLLAHHADDNLETILMRIIKSSSLNGYAGMDTFSNYKGLNLYRPLLMFSKEQIKQYVFTKQIEYFEDESNNADDYTRNRIRHKIVPLLKEENPNIYEAITNYSLTLKEANKLVEEELELFINKQVSIYEKYNVLIKDFKVSPFLDLTNFLQEQIIFRLTKDTPLSKKTVLELLHQIKEGKNKIVNKLSSNLVFVKEYNSIKLISGELKKLDFEIKIETPGVYELPFNQKISVEKNCCLFKEESNDLCYNIQKLPIIIRSRKIGDKLKRKNGTISVSDYLTNLKRPYLERLNTLVLCDEKKEIINILGYKNQYEEDINGRSKKT